MSNIDYNKQKQINDILSVVKLTSLLFSGIGFFRFLSRKSFFNDSNNIYAIYCIITAVLILSLIYCLWAFSTINKFKIRYICRIRLVENLIIILIFFTVILLSGANNSDYKFLFLFIIITATIQSGMKHGMIIAIISSLIILSIDIAFAHTTGVNQNFENDLVLAGIFLLTAWPLGFYVRIEDEHIRELKSLANEDGLTGVYNHRYFHDALREKIMSGEKDKNPVCLIFIDIDYFKYYNDLYGHQKGDMVLKAIGSLLKNNVRKSDIVARYGGEEFAVILPSTSEDIATDIAENIRRKFEETYFEGEENQPNGKLTVSLGISVYPNKAKSDVELIKSADDALYRAKFFNKNRVEAYTSILDELKKDIEEQHIDLITSIKTLISVINAKDRYTYGHVERVVVYSRLLANKLGLNEDEKKTLIYGAYMHDIGKINIAKEILNKKMPLTPDEWELLKQHPSNGIDILKPVESLKDLSPLILHHHERYDGKGYPNGLKGENIPYLARTLTVVDSFDAMTSNRPYTRRKTYEEAIEELRKCSGTQFDPLIAQAFIEVIMKKNGSFYD